MLTGIDGVEEPEVGADGRPIDAVAAAIGKECLSCLALTVAVDHTRVGGSGQEEGALPLGVI